MKNRLFLGALILCGLLVWTSRPAHAQDKQSAKQNVVFGIQYRVNPIVTSFDTYESEFLKITVSSADRPSLASEATFDVPEIRKEDVNDSTPTLPKAKKPVVVTISSD